MPLKDELARFLRAALSHCIYGGASRFFDSLFGVTSLKRENVTAGRNDPAAERFDVSG
jgi:hypothetical protein